MDRNKEQDDHFGGRPHLLLLWSKRRNNAQSTAPNNGQSIRKKKQRVCKPISPMQDDTYQGTETQNRIKEKRSLRWSSFKEPLGSG